MEIQRTIQYKTHGGGIQMKKLTRILVPVDASEGAERAVKFAVSLAETTGAVLDILHVSYFDKDTDAEEESWLPEAIAGSVGAMEKEALERARKHVPPSVTAEYHRRTGIPADEILRFAQEKQTGLIVVGCRGLGFMKGLLLGSVSQEIVERADVSVAVAR